jgi:ligand-binding sensor protein/putative methionine-R-sulfoxide reductase with GAF domain
MADDFLKEFLASSGWEQAQALLDEVLKTPVLWVADNSGEKLQDLDRRYPKLCRLIRSNSEGLKRCKESHSARIQEVIKNQCSIVTSCDCGLVGFAIPLILDNEIIGVAGGCYPAFEMPIAENKLIDLAKISGINKDELKINIQTIKVISRWDRKRLMDILAMFTGTTTLLMKWMNRLFVSLGWEQQYAFKVMSLSEIGMIAGSELNWEDMLKAIATRTRTLLGVDACSIHVLDRNNRELLLSAEDGLIADKYENRISIGENITGRVAQTRIAMAIDDTKSEVDYQDQAYRGVLSMPLMAQDRLIGVIGAYTLNPKEWDQTDVSFLSIISVHVAGIIEKSKFRMEVSKELEVAGYIQMRLIPEFPPKIDGYDVSAITVPNREVSGDYYDFISIDEDRLGISVADVSGKGIGASLLMANTHGLLHAYALSENDASNVIFKINNALYGYTEPGRFVTMVYGILDKKTGTFTYSNAGHNHPLVYRHGNPEPEALETGGIVLGVLKNANYSEEKVQLNKGDTIVFYSDGVTEAKRENGEMFGEKRLHDTIWEYINNNQNTIKAQSLLDRIYNILRSFSSDVPLNDDLTIVVLVVN